MDNKPDPAGRRIAENNHRWPELASLLAPAAGCDCQILAVTIAEEVSERRASISPATPARVRH